MTPPVSETAAWTEQDEREMQSYAKSGSFPAEFSERIGFQIRLATFAREILRLRAENERLTKERDEMRHAPWRRWSVQECDEDGSLLVCKGHHDRSAPCEFEEYIPKPAGRADVAAIGRTLSFFASAIKSGERWTDTCNAEQYNAMKSLAALRSELAAATRESETPTWPDVVRWEVWSTQTGHETTQEEHSTATWYLDKWRQERPECGPWFLVKRTTSRSRVSDNG